MQDNSAEPLPLQTVVGLFDDPIDAEHALAALRKSSRPAASVSVLARDRAIKQGGDSPIDVTRAVMDTALSTMSGWLTGLAALMVPDNGTFLAAGPIGVTLARVQPAGNTTEKIEPVDRDEEDAPVGSVGHAFELFGFPIDEAHYLEQRLAAGSALIAVTSRDEEQIEETLRTFADFDAIFIGQAETEEEVIEETERWLANPMGSQSAEVIVADVVVTLRSARSGAAALADAFTWCGLDVHDVDGARIGEVDDVLVDASVDSSLRYVIVVHGGVLGIAKRRTAVPVAIVERADESVRLQSGLPKLADAPVFDPGTPFSRKDELAAHRYFGATAYWTES